jgi:hypothetical protein
MQDANLLSLTDHTGALLWHPRGLGDIDAVPARTFDLWLLMRQGSQAAQRPFRWLRRKGMPTAHWFEMSPLPPTAARCGQQATEGEWVDAEDAQTRCRACVALIDKASRPAQAWGVIGDTPVGPPTP